LIRRVEHGDERAGVEQDIAAADQMLLPPVALADHSSAGISSQRTGVETYGTDVWSAAFLHGRW